MWRHWCGVLLKLLGHPTDDLTICLHLFQSLAATCVSWKSSIVFDVVSPVLSLPLSVPWRVTLLGQCLVFNVVSPVLSLPLSLPWRKTLLGHCLVFNVVSPVLSLPLSVPWRKTLLGQWRPYAKLSM